MRPGRQTAKSCLRCNIHVLSSVQELCAVMHLDRGESGVIRRNKVWVWLAKSLVLAAATSFATGLSAQRTRSGPATDSSALASPLRPTPAAPAMDSSAQASPIRSEAVGGAVVAPHTAIQVRLARGIDSGHLKNGETVNATLSNAITLSPRGTLNPGTPAELTVVETLPAGRIYAAGEFSLQLLRVDSVSLSTDTLTYRGQAGHKDLPDSAPQVGTDAGLASGAELTFHVLPPPEPANGPPNVRDGGPGGVNGVAAGGPPPSDSSKQPSAYGQTASGRPESGNAPKQPSSPADATSTETAQPHP